MDAGIIGGVVGTIAGIGGGVIGTYFSITNTNGPKERKFMIKMSIYCWVFIIIFLAALLLTPNPYRWFVWIPYGICLPLGIIYINKHQTAIRNEEEKT